MFYQNLNKMVSLNKCIYIYIFFFLIFYKLDYLHLHGIKNWKGDETVLLLNFYCIKIHQETIHYY